MIVRIPLPIDDSEHSDRELQWSDRLGRWTLSEREMGSVRWNPEREPSIVDLIDLVDFFDVAGQIDVSDAERCGPIALARLNASYHGDPSLVLALGEDGSVCTLFKQVDGAWRKYGRRSDGAWWMGEPADPEDVRGDSP